MAAKAGKAALADAKVAYDRGRAGVRRLRLRRLARAASARSTSSASPASRCSTSTTTARPARPRSMLGAQAIEGGARRVRARRRLRADGEGRARLEVDRPREPARQARQRDEQGAGLQLRRRPPRRCSAAPAASTAGSTARSARRSRKIGEKARKHAAKNPYALFKELLSRRGDPGLARGVRSADALPVLPADLRRGRGGPLLRRVREEARHREARVHRGAGDDDRLSRRRFEETVDDQDGRLRHGRRRARRRSTSRPASAPRTSTSSSSTTASPRTSSSPTRRSACARRARPRSSSGTATTPTAASS